MPNKNKNMVILGAGISGIGAAVLALQRGYHVFVSEFGKIKENNKSILFKNNIDFEEGGHSLEKVLAADEIIKSPGISPKTPMVEKAIKAGIPILSEIEFAKRFTNAKHICITGSNGKTTTSTIVYELLKRAGKDVVLAGNIGESYALALSQKDPEYFVLEISSFQLENMYDFKADTAIITNITPDHLDRYDYNFQQYVDTKMRIIQNQTASDKLIYNADDPIITKELARLHPQAKQYPFSMDQKIHCEGAQYQDNNIEININKSKITMTLEELALQGKHNVYNSMAGGIAAKLEGIRKETIKNCLNDMDQIKHRLEYVGNVRGVKFINDSKATNVNSSWFALESQNNPIVWIVGGVDKGNDYESLMPLVESKVKAIICLGKDNKKLREAFEDKVEFMTETVYMDDAVEKAFYLSDPQDVVLLSPACASFDLFENYEDRGNKFIRAVQDL